MTRSDMNLDELPPHALVVEKGQITPVGKAILAKTAEDLIAVCRQVRDPQAALQALPGLITKHMAEIGSRHTHVAPGSRDSVHTSQVGAASLERRPGRPPLTGSGTEGQPDTNTNPSAHPRCLQQHGRNRDHLDALGRT
ncbi:hypothetical protein [Streptomyces sp. NPDC015242]|uniref:hypothetical protein n=1 Tax=Streptomyces sp. NPDC015242 TaxID=3364951 RepID=UPI003702FC32